MTVVNPSNERRAVKRMTGDTIGVLHLLAERTTTPLDASVHDVSIQGFGLLMDASFDPGTTLVIEAGSSGRSPPTELKAHVRHVTNLPNGRWLHGCYLSRPLTLDDMDALG